MRIERLFKNVLIENFCLGLEISLEVEWVQSIDTFMFHITLELGEEWNSNSILVYLRILSPCNQMILV